MNTVQCPTLGEIEARVCDIAAEQLQIPRKEVHPASRLIDDLHCDSLELLELIMELEDRFDVTVNFEDANPIGKAIFTRKKFCLSDLAEARLRSKGEPASVARFQEASSRCAACRAI